MAADIANYIANYLVKFVNSQQKNFANKNKIFIKDRMNLAKDELIESENLLTKFRKSNPINADSPELQLERLRLLRSIEVNQEVFITLRNQYEIAKLEESKERLFINVLDKAYPSINKAHPKIFIIILLFSIFGYFVSIFSLFIYLNIKNK